MEYLIKVWKVKKKEKNSVFSARCQYINLAISFHNLMLKRYWTRIRRDGSYVTARIIVIIIIIIVNIIVAKSLYRQRKMSAKMYLMSNADVTGQPQELFPVPRLPYCKKGVCRQHTTFTSCQNTACSNECFLWRVDYALKQKGFDSENVIFATCISYWEVVARMLIFCGLLLFLVGTIALWCKSVLPLKCKALYAAKWWF